MFFSRNAYDNSWLHRLSELTSYRSDWHVKLKFIFSSAQNFFPASTTWQSFCQSKISKLWFPVENFSFLIMNSKRDFLGRCFPEDQLNNSSKRWDPARPENNENISRNRLFVFSFRFSLEHKLLTNQLKLIWARRCFAFLRNGNKQQKILSRRWFSPSSCGPRPFINWKCDRTL